MLKKTENYLENSELFESWKNIDKNQSHASFSENSAKRQNFPSNFQKSNKKNFFFLNFDHFFCSNVILFIQSCAQVHRTS